MCFVDTIAPESATGDTADLYRRLNGGGYLPNYARVFSLRPQLMPHISALMAAVRDPMPPRLWKLVSFAAALAGGSSYCSLAFAQKLLGGELDGEALLALARGEPHPALDPAEQAAMDFAARVAREPSHTTAGDIERLRAAGFTDREIFDIAAAAAYRCFFSRFGDALGALPDAQLAGLPAELLAALTVGRTPASPDYNAIDHAQRNPQ